MTTTNTIPGSTTQFPDSQSSYEKFALLNKRAQKVDFALHLAQTRENFRWSFGYSTLATLSTLGVGISRGSIPFGMSVFCATTWCGTMYLYDMGYRSMVHRVNKEAHRILTTEMEYDEES